MSDTNTNSKVSPESKVVELSAFKKKRETAEQLARGRKPLYVNHGEGTVSGRPNAPQASAGVDMGDRLTKIRGSLDRINQLMSELKKLSAKDGNKDALN